MMHDHRHCRAWSKPVASEGDLGGAVVPLRPKWIGRCAPLRGSSTYSASGPSPADPAHVATHPVAKIPHRLGHSPAEESDNGCADQPVNW